MQRTAIARALANDPDLLLADEPTGNLDEKTGLEILDLFDQLVQAGRTIILVTHNPTYVERVGRVLRMRDGGLVSSDEYRVTSQKPEFPLDTRHLSLGTGP